MKKMTAEEWNLKGESLYGNVRALWKFRCPSCKGIQTPKDFFRYKHQGHGPRAALLLCLDSLRPPPKIIFELPRCQFNVNEYSNPELILVVDGTGSEVPVLPFAD